MTTPNLAQDSEYGRLYRHPNITPEGTVETAILNGTLMPSVTNVIDVGSKKFLQQWAAKQAATAAVEAAITFGNRVTENPDGAIRWAAAAHTRTLTASAELGDLVHNICEARTLGDTPHVPAEAAPFIVAWEKFVADFNPEFVRAEATMYGVVHDVDNSPLLYAGTTDFICNIQGTTLVGDYKSGKSVYDSAGMQLAALANAHEMVTVNESNVEPTPTISGGIVVHLRPHEYKVYPVTVDAASPAFHAFSAYRRAWWPHARSAASRRPTLVGNPISGSEPFSSLFER